jgi:hypothetical protein
MPEGEGETPETTFFLSGVPAEKQLHFSNLGFAGFIPQYLQ